jgi:hypothetical protein
VRALKRLFSNQPSTASSVADPPTNGQVDGSPDELLAELRQSTEQVRERRDREAERRLLQLRHRAGMRLIETSAPGARFPATDSAAAATGDALPEFSRQDMNPEVLRAGILSHGCVLVRGLVDRDVAVDFAGQIDRSFAERDSAGAGRPIEPGYYEEFSPDAPYDVGVRPWVQAGGGVLAADAPMLAFDMFEMFQRAGLPKLVGGYLGEPALISVHKTTLRKASPDVAGAWHQDGAFMGEVRALNLWLSLSRCGDEAPGLDIVPRRLDTTLATGAEGSKVGIDVSDEQAREAADGVAILRPIFEPGDALFFDELFLHKTGSDPAMPNPRFAIENWFFGASAFPSDYAPLAV